MKNAIALALGSTQVTPQAAVVVDVEKALFVRDMAETIAEHYMTASESAEFGWQFLVQAHLSGVTFDDLEAVELKKLPKVAARGDGERYQNVKDCAAYRQAKKRIKALIAAGIEITPDITTGEAKKLSKGKGKGTQDADGDTVTASAPNAASPLSFTDKVSVVKAALACLTEDAEMRRAFVAEIRAVARMTANEDAETAAALAISRKAGAEKAAADAVAKAAADALAAKGASHARRQAKPLAARQAAADAAAAPRAKRQRKAA